MLELMGFHCWLPGRGHAIDDLTLTAEHGTITALVGRSGSGGDILVQALSGVLPPGSRTLGTATLNGKRLDGATPDELAGTVLRISDAALPGGTVADCLRILTGDLGMAEDLGLAGDLERRLTSLPIDMRLRLHCATLLSSDSAPPALILVDRVLGAADAATRERFCTLLHAKARAGVTVLWAEHDLDAVWQHAGHLVELVDGRFSWSGRPDRWIPHTLPEPTLMTLGRALGIPLVDCRTPLSTSEALEVSGITLPPFPHRVPDGVTPTGSGTVITAETIGLSGPGIEIRPGECIGIVDVNGRPEALARRLIAKLPSGDVVPSQLPATLRLGAAARTWEGRHQLPAGSLLGQLPTLHAQTLLMDLSPGDAAAFRQGLASGPETPLWLSHPQAGLDPRDRHTLAENLRRRPTGTRLVTSRDVEFLVRACHRIVVVQDGAVIGDGSPSAVAHLLPTAPLVSRAVGSTRYLRLTDVLSTTETQVTA